MKHLTDTEIQSFLDNDADLDRRKIEQHLQDCPSCQREVASYRILYQDLNNDSGFMLSANFAESVTARIQGSSEGSREWGEILLVMGAFIVSLGSLIYFLDLAPLFQNILPEGSVFVNGILQHIQSLANGNILLVIGIGIIISMTAFFDKFALLLRGR